MSDFVSQPLILAALGLIIVGAWTLSVVLRRRRENVWRELARKWGLRYESRDVGPLVVGRMDGRALKMAVTTDSSDRDTLGFEEIRIEVDLNPSVPEQLEVLRTGGAVGSVVRMVEGGTVDMKDTDFDREFVVKGDPSAAEDYLSPERRKTLRDLASDAASGDVGISHRRLYWQHRNMVSDLDALRSQVRQLLSTAERLDEPTKA